MATTLKVRSWRKLIRNWPIHLVLIVICLTTVFPFLWMLSTSLKGSEDVFKYPPMLIPEQGTFQNYVDVFTVAPVVMGLVNSLIVAVSVTLGTLLTSSLAGFAFAKLKFRGKQPIFFIFLATLMIPWQVTLIPLYITFSNIGWVDTFLPLIVPGALINAYGVFLMRQFMQTIPDDYVEAAKIDGANYLQIYWNVALPLCKPPLVTLGLFSFIGSWNSFLGPLIYLNDASKFTIQLVINSFKTVYYVQWGLLMAAAAIAVLPILVMYIFAQRFFVEGIALSGLHR